MNRSLVRPFHIQNVRCIKNTAIVARSLCRVLLRITDLQNHAYQVHVVTNGSPDIAAFSSNTSLPCKFTGFRRPYDKLL